MTRTWTTRRGRRGAVVATVLAVIASGSIVPITSSSAAEDRWSGRWDVEGASTENGPYEHFGVLTLETTDFPLDHGESDACAETDVRYVGTYPYGGGGTFEACEIAELNYGLYGKYFNNDGTWGHAYMDFTPGSPATFAGRYAPPTTGTAGVPATLRWRGTMLPECAAPGAAAADAARLAEQADDEEDCSLATEVTFAFKHGGRHRNQPERVKDMTTNGAGSVTFAGFCDEDEDGYSGPYKDLNVRVVRTADIHDVDSPKVDEVKLVFKAPGDGRVTCRERGNEDAGTYTELKVSLRMVSSTDPSCRAGRNGRAATLTLIDSLDKLLLRVPGCPLHSEEFEDRSRIGKKPLVTVAMEIDTVLPS